MGTEAALPQPCYPTQSRRWVRYAINLPVRVITLRLGRLTAVEGRGSNLNRGGMAVSAAIALCTCEEVTLEFTPPGAKQTIRLRGAVRHRRGGTYGVEFLLQDEADGQSVKQLEAILAKLYYPAQPRSRPD